MVDSKAVFTARHYENIKSIRNSFRERDFDIQEEEDGQDLIEKVKEYLAAPPRPKRKVIKKKKPVPNKGKRATAKQSQAPLESQH